MKQKHTEGQWKQSINPMNRNEISVCAISANDTVLVARVVAEDLSTDEEHEANAKLIAAAPLLLEMCIATLEDLQSGELTGNATQSALINLKDAINKATQ